MLGDYFPTRIALTTLGIGLAIIGLIRVSGVVDLGAQTRGSSPPPGVYALPSGQPDQTLLDSIATAVAHKPVRVSCRLPGGTGVLGQTYLRGNQIELTKEVCSSLLYYQRDLTGREYDCVRAKREVCQGAVDMALLGMQALAHEAYHTTGFLDESTTDCHALQAVSYVASRLREDAALAQSAARYYAANYHVLRGAPSEYQLTDECRDGGDLDYRPETNWPG